MKLVLITGAGASTKLGHDDDLPLMPALADRLVSALDERSGGLATGMHLSKSMTGPEFEEALGLFFRWRDNRPLEQRFEGLGYSPPQPDARRGDQNLAQRRDLEDSHIDHVEKIIDEVLFQEFGSPQLDASAVGMAYEELLSRLGVQGGDLVCATTNYDPSIVMGLSHRGLRPDLGFRGQEWETPALRPDGLVRWGEAPTVPVIHLHGAVGWYREPRGAVTRQPPDRAPNRSLGRPALLYPDPDKDPASAVTRDLWDEFRRALSEATHILILGHSLHDPALLREVTYRPGAAAIGVCVLASENAEGDIETLDDDLIERMAGPLPGAVPIHSSFGAKPFFAEEDLDRWKKIGPYEE